MLSRLRGRGRGSGRGNTLEVGTTNNAKEIGRGVDKAALSALTLTFLKGHVILLGFLLLRLLLLGLLFLGLFLLIILRLLLLRFVLLRVFFDRGALLLLLLLAKATEEAFALQTKLKNKLSSTIRDRIVIKKESGNDDGG